MTVDKEASVVGRQNKRPVTTFFLYPSPSTISLALRGVMIPRVRASRRFPRVPYNEGSKTSDLAIRDVVVHLTSG